jgi:hypothetical protein
MNCERRRMKFFRFCELGLVIMSHMIKMY